MSDYKILSEDAPSIQFEEAFVGAAAQIIFCQLCGRTHYGEEYQEEDPDGKLLEDVDEKDLVCHDSTSVGHGVIDGKQFVEDCPCNGLRKYEDFIWGHRYQIVDYYKARLKEMQSDVERESVLFGSLGGNPPRL